MKYCRALAVVKAVAETPSPFMIYSKATNRIHILSEFQFIIGNNRENPYTRNVFIEGHTTSTSNNKRKKNDGVELSNS